MFTCNRGLRLLYGRNAVLSKASATCRRTFSSTKDPYETLGVARSATASEIKRTYFELAKKYHPDANKDPSASSKFVEVQSAYEILSDPQKRAQFDQFGRTEDAASPETESYGQRSTRMDSEDLFNIFRQFGGQSGFDIFGMENGAGLQLDVQVLVNLSFLEAANGTKKSIRFSRLEPCTACSGRGVARGSDMVTCKTCKGTGRETKSRSGFVFASTCRTCHGSGQVNPNPCKSCDGIGSAKATTALDVTIPAGVAEDTLLSLSGQGNRMGPRAGDLLLQFKIAKSDVFERRGQDIFITTLINLQQAILGGNVVVPTINGNVEVKIAPGTQPGEIKKLAGRGIQPNGSHYVKIKVDLPKKLSEIQRAALEVLVDPTKEAAFKSSFGSSSEKAAEGNSTPSFREWLSKLFR